MATKRIDIGAVIARAIETEQEWGDYTTANELTLVRAAVAELIEVSKRAEKRLSYLNTLHWKGIDADLVIALRNALHSAGEKP